MNDNQDEVSARQWAGARTGGDAASAGRDLAQEGVEDFSDQDKAFQEMEGGLDDQNSDDQ